MALSITHSTVATIPDDGTSEVGSDEWNAAHSISGSIAASEITSPGDLTKTDDTNVTLTLGGTATGALLASVSLTLGWTGTLAAARLNSNVVQGVTNDTNVTGSISAQNLTLGWTGTLAAARLNSNVVQSVVNDTNVTGSIATQALTLGWTGTLAASRGGFGADISASSGVPLFATGVATFTSTTGTGDFVRATSPTLVTPALGTPASGTLTNCTGLPVSTGISGLGTGVATFLATPSSANLASAVTGETGSGALVFGTSPTLSGATLSGTTNLTGGQIAFPATQNASSDANTLDDYEEGTWTPALTFSTPGNLSVTYSSQYGAYTKVGNTVKISFNIVTSAFTHTTASGGASINGLPFTSVNNTDNRSNGASQWGGITKTNFTDLVCIVNGNDTHVTLSASGSGQAATSVTAADMPSGGQILLRGTIEYQAAS